MITGTEVRGGEERAAKRRGKERGYVQTTTGEIPAGGSAEVHG